MKISQDNKFKPVTIIIESEQELAQLYLTLNESNRIPSHISSQICIHLYDHGMMSSEKAKKYSRF